MQTARPLFNHAASDQDAAVDSALKLRRCARVVGGIAVVGLLCTFFGAEEVLAQDRQASIWYQMDAGAQAVGPQVRTIAMRVCAAVMGLEFMVTAFFLYVRSESLSQMMLGMFYKAGLLLMLVPIATQPVLFLQPSTDFFVDSGEFIVGVQNPLGVSRAGNELFFETMKAAAPGWSLDTINRFFICLFPAVVMWLMAQLVALAVMVSLIELTIVVFGGSLFLGFGLSRFTAGLADNYFAYAIGIAVKIFFLYVVLGIVGGEAQDWINVIKAMDTSEDYEELYEIAGASLVFALTALYVPQVASSRITSGFSIGFQRAHQPLF
jgi:hypothetical protein